MNSSALVRQATSLERDQRASMSPTAVSTTSPGGPPVARVHPAEAVDVEHDDRQRPAVTARALDLGLEAAHEDVGRRQVGERIADRAGLELALELGDLRLGCLEFALEFLFALAREHVPGIGNRAARL